MASVERTAYPRFPRLLTPQKLRKLLTPSKDKVEWVATSSRGEDRRLLLMVRLKCFQYLHFFQPTESIPPGVVEHVAVCSGFAPQQQLRYPEASRNGALYRDRDKVRTFLRIQPYGGPKPQAETVRITHRASSIVNTVVDVINALTAEFAIKGCKLPDFSTFHRIVEKEHEATEQATFDRVECKLTNDQRRWLDEPLVSELSNWQTRYSELKRSAKKASRQHLGELLEQLGWLESLPDSDSFLEGLTQPRPKYLCNLTTIRDTGEMKGFSQARRRTMTLALIRQVRVRARDGIAKMFIRRLITCRNAAQEELKELQARQREPSEELVAKLERVLELLTGDLSDEETGKRVRELLTPHGSLDQLRTDCEAIRVWNGKNYLPLLHKPFNSQRAPLFHMARVVKFGSMSQDKNLIDALQIVLANQGTRTEWTVDEVDLSFATSQWHKLALRSGDHSHPTNRRFLKVCIFSYLATELRSGDMCIAGSDQLADGRKKMMPWSECLKLLSEYCERADIPVTSEALVEDLQRQLGDTAMEVDTKFPHRAPDVTIGPTGEPSLRHAQTREVSQSAITLNTTVAAKIPSRHLLDVLQNIEHRTNFTWHCGPLSGNDAKIRSATTRYLIMNWTCGTDMGVVQTSRHLVNQMSARRLSFVDRRHMSLNQLNTAFREMNKLFLQLPLSKHQSDTTKVAADGAHYDFYDQNLLANIHFRYKKMGAAAYRRVATNYMTVFHHFVVPGILETAYVIEGLQKARLSVQADTVYSDTHDQSETVFAFTYLSDIGLMPRTRGWKDLKFYRVDRRMEYQHIDKLFTDVADWALIKSHWEDLMQVMISIEADHVASLVILGKLSNNSRSGHVYATARELDRVLCAIYLLRWINSKEMRQEVTGQTNRIEQYHTLSKWLGFDGKVWESDPNEQQKALRHKDIVASTVMLHNAVDTMIIIEGLISRGYPVREEDFPWLSPYSQHTERFGAFALDPKRPVEPWLKDAPYRQAARQTGTNAESVAKGSLRFQCNK